MLISSMILSRGPIITPLKYVLVLKRVHFFIQFQSEQCFEKFVNEVVEARRQGDLNADSAVCANFEKLVDNSAYGNQIMDRSKHTRTKYVVGSYVNTLVNDKMLRKFNDLPNELYEFELGKSKVEHKELIIVGVFILRYAKVVMLELVYDFSDPFCDLDKYEFIKMDTDSLYLSIYGSDRGYHQNRNEKNLMRSNDCRDISLLIRSLIFSHKMSETTCMIRELWVSSKKSSDARRWLPYAQKRTTFWMKVLKQLN